MTTHRSNAPAFTLIEILMVIFTIGVLLTLSTPAIQGAVSASRLRDSGEIVFNHIFEAQQLALTLGTETEVRFYQTPDLVNADEAKHLRKIQVYVLKPPAADAITATTGSFEAVSAATSLSPSIVMSPLTKFTSLLKLGFKHDKEGDIGNYVAFRFHPDGSTNLAVDQTWFVTVIERKSTTEPHPKNFITIQIDPASGRARTFQP